METSHRTGVDPMSSVWIRGVLIGSLLSMISISLADEKANETAKQKTTAKGNLAKIGIDKPVFIETPDLIVCGSITEKEVRSISDLLQKQYTTAYKGLKFDDKDKSIRGKFTVYCFSTKREFTSFARQIRQERPDATESSTFDVSGDDCYMALVVESRGSFAIDPDVSAAIGEALLERKVGGKFVPAWASIGFRKAIAMRTVPKLGEDARKELRGLLTKGKLPETLSEILENDSPEKLLVGASLMEFLTFSPQPKMIDFITAYKPSEEVPTPTLERAKMVAGFKDYELEKAWRNWVLKGK